MALVKCKECGESVSNKAKACPKCGAQPPKRTSLFTWLVLIFFIFVFIGMFSDKKNSPSSLSTTSSPPPKASPVNNVKLDFTWSKGGFDNVMEADFTVTNNNAVAVKDIEITCTHYAKSGTRIDSNSRTIFDIVPANGKKTFQKFNMGFMHSQAVKTGCAIVDIKT